MGSSDSSPSSRPDSSGSSEGRFARHLHPSDLRGTAQLATEATLATTHLVEAVHAAVLSAVKPGARSPKSRIGGLTGWTYRVVRRIAKLSGRSTTWALGALEPLLGRAPRPDTEARQRLLSVLNGVLGDHLAASGSPLSQRFSLHAPSGRRLDVEAPGTAGAAPLVVFVHGLCLSDRDWIHTAGERAGLVEAVPAAVDGTAVLARYNTGRPIWENGRALAEHLDTLTNRPTGPSRIILITHSMGGLVARSAVHHARRTAARWPELVTETVYLGTPHRGAPLERTGAWIEKQLRRSSVTAPFAGLADLRSRGIQDLRRGAIAPNDASHPTSPTQQNDTDLSSGRTLYIAAALTPDRQTQDVIGDGLVPVSSALDRPAGPRATTRRVVEGIGHFELLHEPSVTEHLCRWLSTPDGS